MALFESAAKDLASQLAPALKSAVDELAAVETPALADVLEKALTDLGTIESRAVSQIEAAFRNVLDSYKVEISFVRKG